MQKNCKDITKSQRIRGDQREEIERETKELNAVKAMKAEKTVKKWKK